MNASEIKLQREIKKNRSLYQEGSIIQTTDGVPVKVVEIRELTVIATHIIYGIEDLGIRIEILKDQISHSISNP